MAAAGAEDEGLPGSKPHLPKRTRHWLFTLFVSPLGYNYAQSLADGEWYIDYQHKFASIPTIRFCTFQVEDTAASLQERQEHGFQPHLHLQGYIQFNDPITATNAKKRLVSAGIPKSVHIDAMRGTPAECIEYCNKEEGRIEGLDPWTHGTAIMTSGQRTDWEQLHVDCKQEFHDDKFFYDNHPGLMVKHGAGIQAMRNAYHTSSAEVDRKFTILWGVPGAGKSYAAVMAAKAKALELKAEYYIYRPDIEKASKVWQCKYAHQRVLVWNEFDDMEISKGWLFSLFDGSQVDFPAKNVKGGIDIKADHIYLTSNVDPADWFHKIQPREAWWRRLKQHAHIKHYTKPYPGVQVDRPVADKIVDYDELMNNFGEGKDGKDAKIEEPPLPLRVHSPVLAQDPTWKYEDEDEEGLSQHEQLARARNLWEMFDRGVGSGVIPGSRENPMEID